MKRTLIILLILVVLYLIIWVTNKYVNYNSSALNKIFEKMNLKYFKYSEFDSGAVVGVDPADKIYEINGRSRLKDSGLKGMNNQFILKLDEARNDIEKNWNEPRGANEKIVFRINSGFRTEQYNKHLQELGYPAVDNSSHKEGHAVDIAIHDYTKEQIRVIIRALKDVGFSRFGMANTFIHVDDDPRLKEVASWTYSGYNLGINPLTVT